MAWIATISRSNALIGAAKLPEAVGLERADASSALDQPRELVAAFYPPQMPLKVVFYGVIFAFWSEFAVNKPTSRR